MPLPLAAMAGIQIGGMLLGKLFNRKSPMQKALEAGVAQITPGLIQANQQGLASATRLSKLATPAVEQGLGFYRDVLDQPDGIALQKLIGPQLGQLEQASQQQRNIATEFGGRGGGRLEMNQQGEFGMLSQLTRLLGETRAGAAGSLVQGGLGAQGVANDSMNAATNAANTLMGGSGGAALQQRMREQNGAELGQLGVSLGRILGQVFDKSGGGANPAAGTSWGLTIPPLG